MEEEEQVRHYVRERVNLQVDVTLDKLFASNRGQKKAHFSESRW